MSANCNQTTQLQFDLNETLKNESRTLWVILLTLSMMIVEIAAGYFTGSMALLADGYHMASHAGALSITYFVYKLARSERLKQRLTFGSGKLLPLGGYTSALGLGLIALWMIYESSQRFFNPISIKFNEAIFVAVVGLFVNLLSAFILGFRFNHNHSHEHDHNHAGALAHVVADALTSILAIVALVIGRVYSAVWLDPLIGIVGALVILRWSYNLIKLTAWELLDGHPKEHSLKDLKARIEASGSKVIDLHLWKIGPGNHSMQLIVDSKTVRGSAFFKKLLPDSLKSIHLVVEERQSQ